jgi:hypothetical protein
MRARKDFGMLLTLASSSRRGSRAFLTICARRHGDGRCFRVDAPNINASMPPLTHHSPSTLLFQEPFLYPDFLLCAYKHTQLILLVCRHSDTYHKRCTDHVLAHFQPRPRGGPSDSQRPALSFKVDAAPQSQGARRTRCSRSLSTVQRTVRQGLLRAQRQVAGHIFRYEAAQRVAA